VGDDVLISSNVAIIGNDHDFSDPSLTVFSGGRLATSTVVIEGDTLVGFGSTIIGNLRVGRGAIVGARSVVTRDVEPDTIVAGVPARVIRKRPR
jgi:acetyltransferase-like isoleucine patch superfamily enzyme